MICYNCGYADHVVGVCPSVCRVPDQMDRDEQELACNLSQQQARSDKVAPAEPRVKKKVLEERFDPWLGLKRRPRNKPHVNGITNLLSKGKDKMTPTPSQFSCPPLQENTKNTPSSRYVKNHVQRHTVESRNHVGLANKYAV